MTLSLYKTMSEETRSLVPTQISTGLLLRKLRLQPVSPSPGFPQHRPGDKQKYGEAHVGTICRSTAKKMRREGWGSREFTLHLYF